MPSKWKHLAFGALLAACSVEAPGAPDADHGPVARAIAAASLAHRVPRDLVVAIAAVEGGLLLPAHRTVDADDHVPVAGALELRHGRFDSLARAAALEGADERALCADTDRATAVGVRVLAELGAESGARASDLASWRGAVARLSGLAGDAAVSGYVHDVYRLLRDGAVLSARDGESLTLAAHPTLEVPEVVPERRAAGSPEYPGAIWYQTSCNNKCNTNRPDGIASVNSIVIHDTEGGWNASVATLQNDAGKSVHYIVDADGSRVGQFIPESYTGWHAGNYCWNKHSIGIEHVGYAAQSYSAGLYATSVKLVQNIRKRWPKIPIDRDHVVGHYQIPNGTLIPECSAVCSAQLAACEKDSKYGGSGNHRDPGLNWQWCQYMQRLGGSCKCADAWPLWNCTTDKTEAVRCVNGQVQIASCAPCETKPLGQEDVCHSAGPPPDMAHPPSKDMAQPAPKDMTQPPPPKDLAQEGAADLSTTGASPDQGIPGGDDSGLLDPADDAAPLDVDGGSAGTDDAGGESAFPDLAPTSRPPVANVVGGCAVGGVAARDVDGASVAASCALSLLALAVRRRRRRAA